jgi:hypothetical protein
MYISVSIEELEGILKEAKNNYGNRNMRNEIIIEFRDSENRFDAYISQVSKNLYCEPKTLYHKRYNFLDMRDINPFTLQPINDL